ncbi:hypothetical protein [Streptomyces sp. NPDC029003]|uniref:beta family protein n=1 Tax=Streptomyces sp. NPDC029003 TaxID=3155125 RepID=UPI0033E81004
MAGLRLSARPFGQRRLLRAQRGPGRVLVLARGGARTSWGDARLEECATRQRAKAGGSTEWRAWGTSHHLAVVARSLMTAGHA